MRYENDENSITQEYLGFWIKILNEFFSWSKLEVLEWASQVPEFSCMPIESLCQKKPLDYVMHLLIPDSMIIGLKFDPFKLRKEISCVIENCGDISSDNFDFKVAKENVVKLLNKYNSILPKYQDMNFADEQVKRNKPFYLWFWYKLLKEVLAWSKEDVIEWASKFNSGLNNKESWFYHEGAAYYVVPLIVSKKLNDLPLGMDLHKLYLRLRNAIHESGDEFSYGYNFKLAKKRINHILEGVTR